MLNLTTRPFISCRNAAASLLILSGLMLVAPIHQAEAQSAQLLYEEAESIRLSSSNEADLQRALELYQRAAEQGKNAALYRLGVLHAKFGNFPEAIAAYEESVFRGSSSGQIALAEGHARGTFGTFSNTSLGVPELERIVAEQQNDRAAYLLAQLLETGTGTARNTARSTAIYSELAENGYARALRQIGRLHLRGNHVTNTPKDLRKALDFLERGIAAGSSSAKRDYGLALIQVGRKEEAFEVLSDAANSGVPGAEAELANGHYRGWFGALSEEKTGRTLLNNLVENGDLYAIRYALIHHERRSRRLTELDLPEVLNSLEQQSDLGSEFAARMLAGAYRNLRSHISDDRSKLAKLVEDHAVELGPEALAAETITVLYDKNDYYGSRLASAEYLEGLDTVGLAKGALRLRSIEPRAYVFVLQRQLKSRGMYSGSVNGLATRSTLRAILRFCRQEGYFDVCTHGPISHASATRIMQSLEDT